MHDDLNYNYKSYKLHEWHKLEPYDYAARVEFAMWADIHFLELPKDTENRFIFTDKAYLSFTIRVNKENSRIWADSQPELGLEKPLNDEKVLLWCASSSTKFYGPYLVVVVVILSKARKTLWSGDFFTKSINHYNYL